MAENDGIYGLWKQHVPAPARLYLQTLLGDRSKPFTEKDFTAAELKEMESTIGKSKERLQKQVDFKMDTNKNYLQIMHKFDTGADKLIPLIQKDKEWNQLAELNKKYSNYTAMPENIQRKYDTLQGNVLDRYKDLAPGKILQGILGETNPTVIKDLYKKYANFYSGEGQREKVTQDLQKAALNAQQIARGEGNVQYQDYQEYNPTNRIEAAKDSEIRGSYSDTPNTALTLGRFAYGMNPDGKRVIKDKYDFYNNVRAPIVDEYENMGPVKKAVDVAKNVGSSVLALNPYGIASAVGNAYIGKNGRPVEITYDPEEVNKRKGGRIKVVNSISKSLKGGKKLI